MQDLVIIGSGPSGLTAALYASRLGFSVKIIEKSSYGGALTQISHLANFPGFDGAGADFAAKLKSQAEKSGVKFSYGSCESVKKDSDGNFTLMVDGEEERSRAVLVATGSEPIPLDFTPSAPVSYCALCDSPLYKGKNIAVVGGGNSAIGESIHLARVASSLTIFSRSCVKADEAMLKELKSLKNVKILENHAPSEKDLAGFDGIFVFIGKRPATTFLDNSLLDEKGFIKTKNYSTSIPGLFASGDVRSGSVKQAITASADGASASIVIADYLKSL